MLGNKGGGKDLAQEVFFPFESVKTLRKGEVRPWLIQITVNHCQWWKYLQKKEILSIRFTG
jgi:hypothetical protein